MRTRLTWWFIFSAAALVVLAALGWVTLAVLNLEKRELTARAEAREQESLRLALWRMDSWLAPRLAREAARPYFEYQPFYAQERAYTSLFNEITPGEVRTPSPLLAFTSEYFPIHFQINTDGTLSSPQVPRHNERDLAEATALGGELIDANQKKLDELAAVLDIDLLAERLGSEEERIAVMSCEAEDSNSAAGRTLADARGQTSDDQSQQLAQEFNAPGVQRQEEMSKREYQQRAMSSNIAQQPVGQTLAPPQAKSGSAKDASAGAELMMTKDEVMAAEAAIPMVTVGPLVAMWIDGHSSIDRPLLFVRRVQMGDDEFFQGFVADWLALRAAMLGQINDLIPDARLTMVTEVNGAEAERSARVLATVPAELVTPPLIVPSASMLSPARLVLGITWVAVIGAIVAAGLTLHHSIAYAAKRSRFTSAVTHELRTPLTTFRMYSEMLAENMVRDESQRKAYLETLKSESARLANLVENVLAYARLEEGRLPRHAQTMAVEELLERMRPMLERRAAEAGLTLNINAQAAPDEVAAATAEGGGGFQAPALNRSPSSSPLSPLNTSMHKAARQTRRPQEINVDADAVGQILFNLVDNACKYASGTEVKVRSIEIAADRVDHQLRLMVRDHGPGIDSGCARTIFRPFDRGRHSHSDASDSAIPIPGVGLGLALARGLARDMGGDLALERPGSGQGAIFVLTLPVRS